MRKPAVNAIAYFHSGVHIMRIAKQISRALARRNGWTTEFAEAFVAGVVFRIRRKTPPLLAFVATDAYSMGFRAGFRDRGTRPQRRHNLAQSNG